MIRNLRFAARHVAPRVCVPMTRSVVSPRFYTSASTATSELVAALRSEQKIEKENAAETESDDKTYFQKLIQDNDFEVVATPGSEDVSLVRTVGDETVRVYFNVTEVANAQAFEEEGLENEEFEDEDLDAPVRLNIVVERPKGAIGIEAFAQQDSIVVESVTPYESAALATDESPEADYKRRTVYQGPPFSVLDPSVQGAVQSFLESRNINSDLALFISEYSSYKEKQEYVQWLGKVADILE